LISGAIAARRASARHQPEMLAQEEVPPLSTEMRTTAEEKAGPPLDQARQSGQADAASERATIRGRGEDAEPHRRQAGRGAGRAGENMREGASVQGEVRPWQRMGALPAWC
jgi:hypothetical protein